MITSVKQFSVDNLIGLETRGIEGFLPDAHLSGELQHHRGPLKMPGDGPEHCRMRARLRSALGYVRLLSFLLRDHSKVDYASL